MLEQELASVIRYVLDATGNPAPYYKKVPQDFFLPAAYFPEPRIGSDGDTLDAYVLRYRWYINFFHVDSPEAHRMALNALNAVRAARGLIPLITEAGEASGRYLRIDTADTQTIDDGVAELAISWESRRPYIREPGTIIKHVDVRAYTKNAYERVAQTQSAPKE